MKHHKISGRIAAVAVFTLAATTMVGVSTATALPLTNTTWSVSDSRTGATNVTYTYEFTTATTAGVIKSVTATIPDGATGASVGAGTNYGLGPGTATFTAGAANAPETLTYTLTDAKTVAAGVPLYIEFTGLTNSTTAGEISSTVTTQNALPATIDTATSPTVTFGAASTAVTVEVPQSLTFENNTPSFELQLDPALPALSTVSKNVVLKVRTNAGQGYKLTAKNTGLKTGTNAPVATAYTIADASSTATTPQADNTFGFTAALVVNSAGSSALKTLGVGSKFVGYSTTAADLLTATGPTGNTADVLTITNQVKINFATPAGTYADTITYVATPTY
jgi:hypothetical protein